jgi:hypothetical protein
MTDSKRPVCCGCVHALEVPGSCHISCNNPTDKTEYIEHPRMGVWPIKYDHLLVKSCSARSEDAKDKLPDKYADPMMAIARIFM